MLTTYSVIGFNENSVGIAVQSKYLAVGNIVPFVDAKLGAFVVQAQVDLDMKTQIIEMLRKGLSSQDILDSVLEKDLNKDFRQITILDANNIFATYTGKGCLEEYGNSKSSKVACQGNCLVNQNVLENMRNAFEMSYELPLAERLIESLLAAERSGGEKRGMQSTALCVVSFKNSKNISNESIDLRVDDHQNPIKELNRLLQLHRVYFSEFDSNLLVSIKDDVLIQVVSCLKNHNFLDKSLIYTNYSNEVKTALKKYFRYNNLENKWTNEAKIDSRVLLFMKKDKE